MDRNTSIDISSVPGVVFWTVLTALYILQRLQPFTYTEFISFDRWEGGYVKCSSILPFSWCLGFFFFFLDRVQRLELNLNSVFGGVVDTDHGFGHIFLQMMTRSAEQTLAPMGHLPTLHLQFSYECTHLPYPHPLMLCPRFELADVQRLCVYIYYSLVYEL